MEEQGQPQKFFRFRTASEGKHGHIQGQKTNYPFLKFTVPPAYAAYTKIKGLVTLYEATLNDKDPLKLSPHTLWTGDVKEENGELVYEPYIVLSEVQKNICKIQVTKCYISRVKIENRIEAIKAKCDELQKLGLLRTDRHLEKQQLVEKKEQKKLPEQVRLGYTLFTEDNQYIKGPILSDIIIDGELVKIERIIPACGPIAGENEVALLVNKISKQTFEKVRVYEVKKNDKTGEEIFLYSGEVKFHKDSAIYFEMPQCPNSGGDSGSNYFVQIISNGLPSEPVQYVYQYRNEKRSASEISYAKNEASENVSSPSKRAHSVYAIAFVDAIANTNIVNSNEPSAKKSQETPVSRMVSNIQKIALTKSFSKEDKLEKIRPYYRNGNTIFHDVVEDFDNFLKLHQCTKELAELWFESLNADNQNPLHYACVLDKDNVVRSLIGLQCSIYATDNDHNTPLHIAIECKSEKKCITKFAEIIRDPSKYPGLQDDIKLLLGVYNRLGYTVLHLAVLNDMAKLVAAILTFCEKEKLDACYMQVLGSGDTIMHLAVTHNLLDMAKLIQTHRPDAWDYLNYAMVTAAGLCEQSDDTAKSEMTKMFENIKIQ